MHLTTEIQIIGSKNRTEKRKQLHSYNGLEKDQK